jgi:hypothetical protein
MHVFISSFSRSKSFQLVNDQRGWEEESPHRHDCHDPPHAVRVGFHYDKSPPRRLDGVARSDPWKAPAQVGLPGDAFPRRRSPRFAGSDRWCNNRGENYLVKENNRTPCWGEFTSRQTGTKLVRCLRILARRGTQRRMIAPPTPHETGSPARTRPRRRFQPFVQGTAQRQFELVHLCLRYLLCTLLANSQGLLALPRDLRELSQIPFVKGDREPRKILAWVPPQPAVWLRQRRETTTPIN